MNQAEHSKLLNFHLLTLPHKSKNTDAEGGRTDTQGLETRYTDVLWKCWRMLLYADVCWRNVCWRMLTWVSVSVSMTQILTHKAKEEEDAPFDILTTTVTRTLRVRLGRGRNGEGRLWVRCWGTRLSMTCGSTCVDTYGTSCIVQRRGVLLNISRSVLGLSKFIHFQMQLLAGFTDSCPHFGPHFCIRQHTSTYTSILQHPSVYGQHNILLQNRS
jgi:hypothetical protein